MNNALDPLSALARVPGWDPYAAEIDQLEKSEVRERQIMDYEEAYSPFCIFALLSLLAGGAVQAVVLEREP